MSYIIGQFNHRVDEQEQPPAFITPITEGTARRRQATGDKGTIEDLLSDTYDECISDLTLMPSNYYNFRCQIKIMTDEQTFLVKLVNYDSSTNPVEQFIKEINVESGEREKWVTVEFIFHPLIQFDTILFQLKRTVNDYRNEMRYPKICYQQLGYLKNIINSKINEGISLLKIGVQSHPGLALCVNGEEIRISRTGIFEVKNGVIPVKFFSVAEAAKEVNTDPTSHETVEGWKKWINEQVEIIENAEYSDKRVKEKEMSEIYSECFFDTEKEYIVDSFVLDYMYKDKEES